MQRISSMVLAIAGAVLTSSIDSSQAAELTCPELLAEFDRFPKSLELIECKPAKSSQLRTLEIQYKVKGDRATAVKKFLQREYDLSSLRFVCCGWSGVTGTADDRSASDRLIYKDANSYYYKIQMMSAETVVVDRHKWSEIPWFYVTVIAYLEEP